jgi:hypothetical protein
VSKLNRESTSMMLLFLLPAVASTHAQAQMPFAKWCSDGTASPDFIFEPVDNTVDHATFIPGDFNGDGLTDLLVYRGSDGLFAKWYSTDSGPCSPDFFYRDIGYTLAGAQVYVGDFNGDGLSDVLIYRPSDGLFAKWYADPDLEAVYSPGFLYQDVRVTIPHAQLVLGDFNGDGLTDVLIYRPSDGVFAKWYSTAEIGPGFLYQPVHYGPTSAQVVTGDFNGDRLTDVLFYQPVYGFNGLFQKWYSTPGIGPDFDRMPGRTTMANGTVLTGDFNGDGLTDILLYNRADGRFAKGYGGGYGPDFIYQATQYTYPLANFFVGDFDGDGRSDLLVVAVTRLHPDQFFEKWFGEAAMVPNFNRQPAFATNQMVVHGLVMADFNGDRATDVLALGAR